MAAAVDDGELCVAAARRSGGDARRSSVILGQLGVAAIVDETVKAIRQAVGKRQ